MLEIGYHLECVNSVRWNNRAERFRDRLPQFTVDIRYPNTDTGKNKSSDSQRASSSYISIKQFASPLDFAISALTNHFSSKCQTNWTELSQLHVVVPSINLSIHQFHLPACFRPIEETVKENKLING